MRALLVSGLMLLLFSGAVGVSAAGGTADAMAAGGAEDVTGEDLDPAVLAAVEAVNDDPENFGVPSLDDEGVLVIAYVGQNAGRAAVEERLTTAVKVRWEQVKYSWSELRRIRSEIFDLRLDGVFGVSSGTNRNRVVVKVGPSGSVSKVTEALKGYGEIVVVESSDDALSVAACNDRYDCTNWRGGIAIFRNDNNARCTWGFQASNNGYLQMVTAGHCHHDGGKHNHDGVTIGSNGVGKNALKPSTFEGIDAERTRVDGPYWPTNQNRLYATDTNKSWDMTSVRSNANFVLGMLVAKAGSTTNYTVGDLDDIEFEGFLTAENPGEMPHYPDCFEGGDIVNDCPEVLVAHSDTVIDKGDSGGPVFIGNVFLGIVSGGGGASLYFSRQQDVKNALGLDFWCTTPGCP